MSSRSFQKLLIATALSLGPTTLGCGKEEPDVGSETAAFRYGSDKHLSKPHDSDGGVDDDCADDDDSDAGADEGHSHQRRPQRARGFFWHWLRHHPHGQQQQQAQQQHGSR